jgi:crossover junction endonuclease MUS81
MARMLQCIRGLSEEKIAALIEHYPTPRSLYEAFIEAEEKGLTRADNEESQIKSGDFSGKGKKKAKTTSAQLPEFLLTELGDGGRRKIGPALSKHVYEIFMGYEYES